ncbi:MAG: hypothetical protein ACR2NU_01865 [Aeoliella sp.]
MSDQRPPFAAMFSQVDVTTGSQPRPIPTTEGEEQTELLRDVLTAQDRTNELLEELIGTMAATQKQRSQELNQWKKANPDLSESCHEAAEALSQVHVEYIDRMVDDINHTRDDLVEGEFMLNEFIDRYGPRLAQLNGVIQTLAQLGTQTAADTADAQQ